MSQYILLFSPLKSTWVLKLLGLVVVDPEEPLRVYAPNFPDPKDIASQLYDPPITYKGIRSLFEIANNAQLLEQLTSVYHEDTIVSRYDMRNVQQNFRFLLSNKSYSEPVMNLIHSQRTSSAYFITGLMVSHRPKEVIEPATSHNFSEVKSTGISGISGPSQEPITMNMNDDDMIFAIKYHKLKLKGVSRFRQNLFSNLFPPSKKDLHIDVNEAFLGQTQVGLIVPNGSEAKFVKSTLDSNDITIPPHELKILSHPESSNSEVRGHLGVGSGSLVPDLHSQSLSPDDVFIMLVGVTGSGKSAFISKACSGLEGIIGHDLNSYTREIKIYSLYVEGRKIRLIDTPGFDDTYRSDHEILQEISAFLADLHQRNLFLSGIIYLQRISDKRFTSSASLSMIKSIIGRNNLPLLTFVTTFWDMVGQEDGYSVEHQLRNFIFYDMMAKGSKYHRYYDSRYSALRIITNIVHEGRKFVPGEREKKTEDVPFLGIEMEPKMEKLQLVNTELVANESSTQRSEGRPKSSLSDRRVFMLDDIIHAAFIAVMGPTGSGKSNFIQKASGNMGVRVGHGLTSETQRVQFIEFYHEDVPVVLIDTPGFNDTYRSDVDILEEISISLAITYRQNIRLAGVIYMQSILDARMQGSAVRNIEIFNRLCGEDPLKRITFVTSFWDEIELDIGITREEGFKKTFWKGTSYADSRIYRFFNTSASAIGVLERITLKSPVILDIQREVVDGKYEIIQTKAGRFLNRELVALDQNFIERLNLIKNDIVVAEAEHDEDLQMALLEQRQWIEQRLTEFRRQQKLLRTKQTWIFRDFERSWDQKFESLKAEFEAKEAAREDLKQKMNKERAAASRQLREVSERANSMVKQIKMITSKNEADRAWYEKRIQELESKTEAFSGNQTSTMAKTMNETHSTTGSGRPRVDTVKGFVDQANRFFSTGSGTDHQDEYRELTAQSCEFLQLMSCFECDMVPSNLFLRACSPRRRWDSTGEITTENPRQSLIPEWLIDIFFSWVGQPNILPKELEFAHKQGMLELVERESFSYFRLSDATKTRERNILNTTDHRNALFNIISILIYSLPYPFTEILWEETLWQFKEVVETTCRPFLSVVSISDLEDYLSQFPIEFRTPYLIQLLYFILDESFYRNLSIPPFAWQVVQLVKEKSSNADLDLAEVVGIRMLRELFVQSFKAGISAEKIMLVAKDAYCYNERMTAFVALTIDFLQRSAMTQSAREELADLANAWTPYREGHISTMELISQALISAEFSDSIFRQLRTINFQLRTATGFAISRRQRFKIARLVLEQCIDEIEFNFSRDSHEYATTLVELIQACNVLGDFNASEKWAVLALPKEARSKYPKNPETNPFITLTVNASSMSKDLAALQISLADTFIGQGRYAEARELLTSILKPEATSNYMTIVCCLRLNKVYRRIHAREELDLHERSPLCKAISLLGDAENALEIECAEELACTLSILQQRDPRDVTKLLPNTIRESYPMKEVLDAHSALLAK